MFLGNTSSRVQAVLQPKRTLLATGHSAFISIFGATRNAQPLAATNVM